MNHVNIVPWIVAFGIVAVCTIIGNLLFLVVFFKSDRLRRMRTSLLLISLTAADLIVGAVAIPMYMALLSLWSEVANSKALDLSYTFIDVLSAFASLFGLSSIALERVYSVFRPHKHRALSKTPYCLAFLVIWLLAALQAILTLLRRNVITLNEWLYCVYPWIAVVVIVIIVSYCAVWIKLKENMTPGLHNRRVEEENKLAKTLAILTGIFLITWLPFFIVNLVLNLCIPCRYITLHLVFTVKLLHYSNSLANPVVYSFRFPEVRRALAKIFCRQEEVHGSSDGIQLRQRRRSTSSGLVDAPEQVCPKNECTN